MKKNTLLAISALFACLALSCATNSSDDPIEEETCTPGCANGVLTKCTNGQKSTETCTNGCNSEGTACKDDASETCTPGCANGVLTKCTNGQKSTETCTNGCNDDNTACKDNASVPLCTPRCDGNNLIVCHGSEESSTPCPKGCDSSVPKCIEDACTPSCKNGVYDNCSGTTVECPNGCNEAGTNCQMGGGEGCEYATKCDGNMLKTCDSVFGELTFNCDNYSSKCSTIDGISDCRETCSQANETKTKCNQGTMTGSSVFEYACTKATDDQLYWNRNDQSETACNSGESCNAAFTACELAQTCSYGTTPASCVNNVATTCIASDTIQTSDCTAHGKVCSVISSTVAECMDPDLATCTNAGSTIQKCGISESTMTDVTITYTCKQDADGTLRYLDGVNELCAHGCDPTTGKCKVVKEDEENQPCSVSTYVEHCTQNYAIYCLNSTGKTTALDCKTDTCLEVYNSYYTDIPYVDCFNARLKCTNEGEKATLTDPETHKDYLAECSKTKDGQLYYAEIGSAD